MISMLCRSCLAWSCALCWCFLDS